jgi:hypothetical protein
MEEWLPDPHLCSLVRLCVSSSAPTPERGLAQGAPLSPLLANLYLDRFDSALLQAGQRLVRYADDFLILCATRQQAEAALAMSQRLLSKLGLRLNPEKTRIVHRDEGFTFLGWTFTREGKRPSDQAVRSLRERLVTATDELARRQILAGWQGYFGDSHGLSSIAASPASRPANSTAEAVDAYEEPWWAELDMEVGEGPGEADLAVYRERFLGRGEVFARFWEKDGRQGYTPVRRPVSDEELRAHLAGEMVLGTFLLFPDGTTKALVLDIDGPDYTDPSRERAFRVAQQLVRALTSLGIKPLWLDSAGKGYHLWLCFREPISARAVREWAGRWLDQFRPFPEGVLVEVFPKQHDLAPGQLGALIRLPLGRHPQTGRFSTLLSEEGKPVTDPWTALATAPLVEPKALLSIGSISPVPEPPEAIAPVVRGCNLISGLVKKAAQTHHLRHTERLALLYTLGHLGEAGENYLHQVISLCSNYDPRVTERWLRRLEEGHRAIRCATLKEWLKDFLPGMACPCDLKARNPSPLDWLQHAPRPGPEPEPGPSPAPVEEGGTGTWEEVAEDIFGEALAEDGEGTLDLGPQPEPE